MKNENGFTLIELLAVIVVLAIIMVIATLQVNKQIEKSRVGAAESTAKSIVKAVKLTGVENGLDSGTVECDGTTCKFNGVDLYLDGDVPTGTLTIRDLVSSGILITKDKKYKISIKDDIIEISKNDGSSGGISNEVNAPSLTDNMVPVIYDNGNWEVADTSKEWYNYDKKMWANAVVLTDKSHPSIGTIITESQIDSMLVWVPRYEYQIPVGVKNGSEKEIPVNFTKSTTPSAGYTIHPAFTFGEQQLSGIWVGKFEVSGIRSNITIKPNIQSLRNVNVSGFYNSIYNTQNKLVGTSDRTNYDTHMMKNIEWGCVAYLSHSKYGINKEISINNSSSYLTGRSGGNVGGKVNTVKTQFPSETSNDTNQYFKYGYYTYDGKTVNYDGSIGTVSDGIKGMDASTTGNIYGIYDMSGGDWEYMMSFMKTEDGNGIVYQFSGFTNVPKPNSKYYDLYDYSTNNITYERGRIGDATKELNPSGGVTWYGDYAYLVDSGYSFVLRGGYYGEGSYAGVFHSDRDTGNINSISSARLVVGSN